MNALVPKIFGFNAKPGKYSAWLMSIPFIIMVIAYIVCSYYRLSINPSDKLTPSPLSIWNAFYQYAFTPDKRTGEYLLLIDWLSSVQRLTIGIGSAAIVGGIIGMNAGLYPGFRHLGMPFVTFVSIIPPLALLPILFITFGTDEVGKVALIFFGTIWVFTRDIYQYVAAVPDEQLIKGLTLGASQLRITWGIIMPQVIPKLLSSLRINLGSAWLFLIASESIASNNGLGFRIFLVRRYMAMDVIIPYVMVITLTGFLMDWGLRKISTHFYPWYTALSEKDK